MFWHVRYLITVETTKEKHVGGLINVSDSFEHFFAFLVCSVRPISVVNWLYMGVVHPFHFSSTLTLRCH